MGWKPNHGRVKEKYNPIPNAEEKRHESILREMPCLGCGVHGVVIHHVLSSHPAKRWRRDHRFQVPVCYDCHVGPVGIHTIGEPNWCAAYGIDLADWAWLTWEGRGDA